MTDPFLQNLKGDWQNQEADIAGLARRLRRARYVPHLLLAVEILGGLVGLAGGLLILVAAIRSGEALFYLAAPVLLIGTPLLAIAALRARRGSLRWEDETAESVLRTALARAESSRRAIQVGRWGVYTLAGFVAALWAALALGIVGHVEFVVRYSAVCAAWVAIAWAWLEFRTRRVRREMAACRAALAEFEGSPLSGGRP